ncbi:peptide chain release factor N(5)-glutamine methyltransferase [Pedobacter frigoris]|uniref:peptide chain release factor N(5)-glutamine methyltransferase n=1 Tax=Pedobacter frigoris TaxID=2571272 RepID=A0A4U1CRH7_9SPHI|nr:peptide chain release factor N(5)-glutamine methyltransferase [Pedobacter frigoris]TKC09485.1 peptide chain release factor N(5)-glutamine methyltransferase [Pedobacter frigoris]
MNLKQVLQLFTVQLQDLYEETEITSIFNIVAGHISGLNRAEVTFKKEDELTKPVYDAYIKAMDELRTGVPMQYVLGETEFYGLPFNVSPSVLIPRPETEELVEWIIEDYKLKEGLKFIDIGTGSGCIAITLEKKLPGNVVFGLDVSKESLKIAVSNASLNNSDVIFTEADIRTYCSREKFDVIVSNPPYITLDEQEEMHQNVFAHEPHLALFVSNEKPLVFYEAIADFAMQSLKDGGLLYFEINEHLGKETVEMLRNQAFSDIVLKKDMQGKDRMVRCRLVR